ncbi:MAG: hypothetical protein AVDCRST_MAG67-2963, partial [uncultured Solirubrobacteraceae bacterium]
GGARRVRWGGSRCMSSRRCCDRPGRVRTSRGGRRWRPLAG